MDADEANALSEVLAGCGDTSALLTETPAPAPTPAPETSSGGCHPAYDPCLPNLPGDALNCGDIDSSLKPVNVRKIVGVDPVPVGQETGTVRVARRDRGLRCPASRHTDLTPRGEPTVDESPGGPRRCGRRRHTPAQIVRKAAVVERMVGEGQTIAAFANRSRSRNQTERARCLPADDRARVDVD